MTGRSRTDLLVVTALRSEYAALLGRVPGARLERCGMGPARVARWLPRLTELDPRSVVVAGVAGGLDPSVRAGDVVVGSEVRAQGGGSVALATSAPLAAELRRHGFRVHHRPLLSCDHLVNGAERHRLAVTGAVAVDMESAGIVVAVGRLGARDRSEPVPVAVVRVVVDTVESPLAAFATLTAGAAALRTLRRLGPALRCWAGPVVDVDDLTEHVVIGGYVRSALPGEVVDQWEFL